MTSTCVKCGAKNDGTFAGYNPCHERVVVENHEFVLGPQQQPVLAMKSIAPSTASTPMVNSLIHEFFTAVVGGVGPVVGATDPIFEPIQWQQNSDEQTKVTQGLEHLTAQLPKYKNDILEHFKIVDVHKRRGFMEGFLTPTVKVRGTVDLVLTHRVVAGDVGSLAIGAIVVFELKTGADYADSFPQLEVELMAIRVQSNKPVIAILTDLVNGAISLRICYNVADNNFYLERIDMTLEQMGVLLRDFLNKPCLTDVLHKMADDSVDPDEKANSLYAKRRRIGPAVEDHLAMFRDLVEDPELDFSFKQQATSNMLRCFGLESSILALDEAERRAYRASQEARGDAWMHSYV